MAKKRKNQDKIYHIYLCCVESSKKHICELRKGWCVGEEGNHTIEFDDFDELDELLNDAKPCTCEECKNNLRLEDVVENRQNGIFEIVKEEDVINNYTKARNLSEKELDDWWKKFNYSKKEENVTKVIRIVNYTNDKACYSTDEYPNIRYKGYYMCFDSLHTSLDVLENKYLKKDDCIFPEHRWSVIDVFKKRDVYKCIMNAKSNLEKYGIKVNEA